MIKRSVFMMGIVACLASCVKDPGVPAPAGGDEMQVRFSLRAPSMGGTRSAGTRAMSEADENTISTVDVLAFVKDAGGDYRYRYMGAKISRTENGSEITVTATVKAHTTPQVFVILCNASAELASAGIALNEKLSPAMRKITCATATGEWPSRNDAGGEDFKPIPMYARTSEKLVTQNETFEEFPLVRMLARIDVTLKSTIANFVLTEAMLFNHKTSGYVAYDLSDFRYDAAAVGGKWCAHQAAVPAASPAGPELNSTGNPIWENTDTYKAANSGAGVDPRGEIVRKIYAFESPAYADAGRLTGTALIIGGKYDGSDEVTYYRVNLKTTDDTDAARLSSHILRNHLYKVEIASVGTPGSGTPKDAYVGESTLTALVTKYDMGAQGVIIDGRYNLTLSHERLDFGNEGGTPVIELSTDYDGNNSDGTAAPHPAGIFVSAAGAPSWLRVTTDGGAALATQDGRMTRRIKVVADPYSSGSGPRTAQFTVTAGNINYEIKAVQSKDPAFSYTVQSSYAMNGDLHSLKVTSTFNWTAAIKPGTNDGAITQLFTASGGKKTNEEVWFVTYDNIAGGPGAPSSNTVDVKLVFTDRAGVCAAKEVTVRCVK